MEKTIWKFPLPISTKYTLEIPKHYQILTVQLQDGAPVIWALVYPGNEKITITLETYQTGHSIPEGIREYVGTFQMLDGKFVSHVFIKKMIQMQKIISLFQRNYDGDRLVRDEVTPGAEWVINGEGIATRKWDGTCCMIKDGVLYKRYDAKKGKTPPDGFIAAQEPDPVTGHWPGWLQVGNGPDDKWFREGDNNFRGNNLYLDSTYELVGPKINGNKDGFQTHLLIPHGKDILENVPRTYEGLKDWFLEIHIEGVVWHHSDGRMVKIKKKDFGFKW